MKEIEMEKWNGSSEAETDRHAGWRRAERRSGGRQAERKPRPHQNSCLSSTLTPKPRETQVPSTHSTSTFHSSLHYSTYAAHFHIVIVFTPPLIPPTQSLPPLH
ncbi:hypothetical protein E2C01_043554 [Portunus trituberculatus]|uniref:Uncharacterized protein n=1 Tax=Portunus trituberculatus TaxID=210409 RepID=A0A5B7FXM9_PORTR|nr:hypothetical protein [Portunus trituberculatus]